MIRTILFAAVALSVAVPAAAQAPKPNLPPATGSATAPGDPAAADWRTPNPDDVLVIDTAAGIGDSVVSFVRAAQKVLLVVCDEPTSITDAYALIKLLNRDYGMNRFRVLANMAQSPQEGRNLFAKLTKVTDRFLDVALQYVGAVPYDESVRKAVQKQRAVYEAFPRSKCSLAFKAIAQKVNTWPLPANPRGHLEFFVERLVQQTAGPVL